LYDGLCGLCDGVVQFMLARDTTHALQFATLQGEYAQQLIARHPELASVDSIILVRTDSVTNAESVVVRSDAAIVLAECLGGAWRVAGLVARAVPKPIRDFGYDLIARIRYRVVGRRSACRIPTLAERQRFID
jgi:predicted DCC family thiol-disulfide oxidoreductase YuxK